MEEDRIFGTGDFQKICGCLRMLSEDKVSFGFLFFECGFGGHGVFFLVERFGGFLDWDGFLESRGIRLHAGGEELNKRFKVEN